jgi:hypothetical protein
MGFFDTILAKVDAADRTVLDKYPELTAAMTQMEANHGKMLEYTNNWLDWQKKYWDPEANSTVAEKELRAELAAAQARLTTSLANPQSSATDIAALRKELQDSVKAVGEKSEQSIRGMHNFYQTAAGRILSHKEEFGEQFNPQTLIDYMTSTNTQDPSIAYDKMVADKRAVNSTRQATETAAKHAADIEAARAEGRKLEAQERTMGPNGMMPTDSTGGIAGITAHVGQPAKIGDTAKAEIANAKLGSGDLAKLGYKAYLQGAFEGPVQ